MLVRDMVWTCMFEKMKILDLLHPVVFKKSHISFFILLVKRKTVKINTNNPKCWWHCQRNCFSSWLLSLLLSIQKNLTFLIWYKTGVERESTYCDWMKAKLWRQFIVSFYDSAQAQSNVCMLHVWRLSNWRHS